MRAPEIWVFCCRRIIFVFRFPIIYYVSVVVSQGAERKEVTSCLDKSGMRRWWDEKNKNKCRRGCSFLCRCRDEIFRLMSLGLLYHCLETLIVALDPAGQGALGMGKGRDDLVQQAKKRGCCRYGWNSKCQQSFFPLLQCFSLKLGVFEESVVSYFNHDFVENFSLPMQK